MKTKLDHILAAIKSTGATCNRNNAFSLPRVWIYVTGIKLETLQNLFPKIEVSILDENNFAFPVDTVELPEGWDKPLPFTVVAVSSNANSFGYKQVICLAPSGVGFKGLVQAYGTDKVPTEGEQVLETDPRWYYGVDSLPKLEADKASKIVALAKKAGK